MYIPFLTNAPLHGKIGLNKAAEAVLDVQDTDIMYGNRSRYAARFFQTVP